MEQLIRPQREVVKGRSSTGMLNPLKIISAACTLESLSDSADAADKLMT